MIRRALAGLRDVWNGWGSRPIEEAAMSADVRCAGTPNGWGGNYVWPASDQLRPPCGWAGTSDQADSWADGAVLSCPRCGGKVEILSEAER